MVRTGRARCGESRHRQNQSLRPGALVRDRNVCHPRMHGPGRAGGDVGVDRVVADAGHDEQLPLREAGDDRNGVGRGRPHVEAAADPQHRNVRQRSSTERRTARGARPVEAEVGVPETRRPASEGTEPAGRDGVRDRGLLDGVAVGDRRVRRPRERAVAADGRGIERKAEIDGALALVLVELGEAQQRLPVAAARGPDGGGKLGRQARVEVGVYHQREHVEAVHLHRLRASAGGEDLAA